MYSHKSGITLRKAESSDINDLLCLKNESWWSTHKTLIANIEDQQNWYKSIPNDQLYMIAEWQNHKIGIAVYTDIDPMNRTLKISGSIFCDYRKPEIIKPAFSAGLDFAFEMLNVNRVEAEVLEYNIPSQKLQVNHLGFKVEGRKRKAIYKCGRYYDSIMMSMLREEWEAHPRVKEMGDICNNNFSHDKMQKLSDRFSLNSVVEDQFSP